jgi:UDP-N-acetyl-D-galactosamine dehydrogenase
MYPPIAATPQPRADGSVSAATRVTVVGLGYVGLPLAVALARQFFVTGLDIDRRRIAELSEGHDRTARSRPGSFRSRASGSPAMRRSVRPATSTS